MNLQQLAKLGAFDQSVCETPYAFSIQGEELQPDSIEAVLPPTEKRPYWTIVSTNGGEQTVSVVSLQTEIRFVMKPRPEPEPEETDDEEDDD